MKLILKKHLDAYSDVLSVPTEDPLRDQNAVDLASALRVTSPYKGMKC